MDRIKFEELYRAYHQMVYHLCLGFVKGDADAAHDLSQETFIHCWQARAKFQGKSSYKTWVYRIAVNTCLQHLRRSRKKQRVPLNEVPPGATTAPEAPAAPYRALYKAIGQLNEVDRLIITMVLEELDYDEIAEVMGLKAGTLRVRIYRIKKALKKRLRHERAE